MELQGQRRRRSPAAGPDPHGPIRSAEEWFARVAVPAAVRTLFTYRIPPELRPACLPGSRVVVPFGRSVVTGFVTAVGAVPDLPAGRIRDIQEIPDPEPIVPGDLLEFTRWIADHYIAPWGEVIKASLPAGIHVRSVPGFRLTPEGEAVLAAGLPAERKDEMRDVLRRAGAPGGVPRSDLVRAGRRTLREVRDLVRRGLLAAVPVRREPRVRERGARFLRLVPTPAGERPAAGPGRGRIAAAVLQALESAGGELSAAALAARLPSSGAAVRRLVRSGILIESYRPLRSPEPGGAASGGCEWPRLNPAQERAVAAVEAAIRGGEFRVLLLRGITGSGKTEVYLRGIAQAARAGRRALYLVPEIALTPLLEDQIRSRFPGAVEVLHSGRPERERLAAWRRIRAGEARVVLGTRSAVFAPQADLGLVIVDEEQEESYKQEESPRYHGRDAAIVRGRLARAAVILGTATPALETDYHAATGRYALLELPERVGERPLPAVHLVDMREEFQRRGERTVLSAALEASLRDRRGRGEQSLVLLNRRGWAAFLLCRACGRLVQCSRCSISYTYHRGEGTLKCHYCGRRARMLATCPACGSPHLHLGAEGTEQVEAVLRETLPGVRLARMDRDTVGRRGRSAEILRGFEAGEYEVLLGTQMIAKGHHFPRVTLVGVLSADHLLAFPDFRAAERTFQLLTQVAGRAGRGEVPGEVVIQAFHPDHYALQAVRSHDPRLFYDRELHYRRILRYPPFTVLAALIVRNRKPERAAASAAAVARVLEHCGAGKLRVLGPAAAPLGRLRGEYRQQILVKAEKRGRIRAACNELLRRLPELRIAPREVIIDIDPITTM